MRASAGTALLLPDSPDLPAWLPCTFPVLQNVASLTVPVDLLLPTHLLAIHAPDSPRTLLLPIHGLLYAAASPALSRLSSATKSDCPTGGDSLPVIRINLPSALAIPLLQGWLCLRSKEALLAGLLPTPPPPSSSSSLASLLNPTASTLTTQLSSLGAEKLLQHVELLHGLWSDVCALEVGDEELWAVMRFAWGVVVGALVLVDKRV